MTRETCARGGVQPLLSAGRRVVVDGHPICDVCGRAVEQYALERWRHARRGALVPRVTPAALRACNTHAELVHRFPSLDPVSAEDWSEARRRLAQYEARLSLRPAPGRHDNPYADIISILAGAADEWRVTAPLARLLDLAERRRELAPVYSWAIPNEAALEALARHAPLVECGAGSGYWAALLRAREVDVVAFDVAPPKATWTLVEPMNSLGAARRYRDRTLVLCWPPYDDDAASYGALRVYGGDTVVHIGERGEGATGSVRFHRELELNWTLVEELELPHWPRLRDTLSVYRRNPRRRAHTLRDRCFDCKRFIPTGAIGRCDACFRERPPALALRAGRHRVEYPQEVVDAMPPALRKAFESSPNRIR